MNQHTVGYKEDELKKAKFRKRVLLAAAQKEKEAIDALTKQLEKHKRRWHNLLKKAKRPIGRLIEDVREMR